MTELATFEFPATGAAFRIVLISGEPWFIAHDACAALEIGNGRMAVARLQPDDVSTTDVIDSMGRTQSMNIINEAALYDLIFLSRKPQAKAFQQWVTHDVLPAIRRTGRYESTAASPELPVPRTLPEALRAYADEVEAHESTRARLIAAAPKAEYVDEFVNPDEDESLIRVFAGQLGVGEKTLRAWLQDRKLIYRRVVGQRWSNAKKQLVNEYEWLAYAEYATWFRPVDQPQAPRLHNGQMATTLYVTPVGKVAIRRLLMRRPIAEAAA